MIRKVLVAIAALFIFNYCNNISTNPDDIVFPEENVSYKSHVEPIIKINCARSNCHGQLTAPNAAPMWSYNELMYNPLNLGLIQKYFPDESRLIQIIENKVYHAGNPYYNWLINDNQNAGLRQWIEEGALNI